MSEGGGPRAPAPGIVPTCWYACLYRPTPTPVASAAPLGPSSASSGSAGDLAALAEDFSPRYQAHRDDLIVIDVSGLDRLFGDPRQIGEALRRSAAARGGRVQIAMAATRTAAKVLAIARPGLTVVARGGERDALAPVALDILQHVDSVEAIAALNAVALFKRWGLKTLGELAALPPDGLTARVGRRGLTWHALARGEDIGPLVPTLAAERFDASIELEWPIEGLEPVSFVLTRLLEPLSTRLERRDRGAAAVHVTLHLVDNHDIERRDRGDRTENSVRSQDAAHSALNGVSDDTYTRSLQLPAPIRDVRTLRTLILLDLESHPPPAAIERVAIVIDPTPGRVLQHALFVRAHPTPDQLSTLIARLHALMGQDRVGRPMQLDSYRPGAFGMAPFPVDHGDRGRGGEGGRAGSTGIVSALRRCRQPVPARVAIVADRPVAVTTDRRGFAGGRVLACAGPWHSSGQWWETRAGGTGGAGGRDAAWNREEWDVSLSDGAIYRIFKDRITDGWFIDAIMD